jgi:hypothetical protein
MRARRALTYDHLVVAVGARATCAVRSGITFGQDPSEEDMHRRLGDLERGSVSSVAFVVPAGIAWPLPLYEIALMTAGHAWGIGIDRLPLTLITPRGAATGHLRRGRQRHGGQAPRAPWHRVHRLVVCRDECGHVTMDQAAA